LTRPTFVTLDFPTHFLFFVKTFDKLFHGMEKRRKANLFYKR
jgi:hypothetical protein